MVFCALPICIFVKNDKIEMKNLPCRSISCQMLIFYKTIYITLCTIHSILGILCPVGPLLTHNQYMLALYTLANLSTLLCWKCYGGCIITTIENQLKMLIDPQFNYIKAENQNIRPTPFWRYCILIISILYGSYQLI